MEAKRLMKVTYQDLKKGIRLNAYADAVIWSEDPSPTLAGLRFGGYAEVVRGLTDAIYGGATIEIEDADGSLLTLKSLSKQYHREVSHEGLYAEATLIAEDEIQESSKSQDEKSSKHAQKDDLFDDNVPQQDIPAHICYIFCHPGNEDELFQAIDQKSYVPMIPEYQDYVLAELKRRRILRPLRVRSLYQELEAWKLCCEAKDQNLVKVMEDGLKQGKIKIPGAAPGPSLLDGVHSVTDYLNTFGVAVAERIKKLFVPLFDPATEPLSEEVLDINEYIRAHAGYSLYDAQLAVAESIKRKLGQSKVALIVAGCGTGKTKIGSVAVAAAGLQSHQISAGHSKTFSIVLCPAHVTKKWVREIEESIPNTFAAVVRSISEFDLLYKLYEQGSRNCFAIISKEKARDGYMRAPAVIFRKWNREGLNIARPHANEEMPAAGFSAFRHVFCCPDCGAVIMENISKDGVAYCVPAGPRFFRSENRENHKCKICGSSLWTALNPTLWNQQTQWAKLGSYGFVFRPLLNEYREDIPNEAIRDRITKLENCPDIPFPIRGAYRTFPLSSYIKRAYKGKIFALIADELHQYNNNSGQGDAMQELLSAAKKVVGMTATLVNGYSSGLFYLLYRIAPRRMCQDGKPYRDSRKFDTEYGVIQNIYEEREGAYNSNRRTVRSKKGSRLKPGVSPLVYTRFLLDCTAFLNLTDMGKVLPEYEEIPVPIEMAPEVRKEYKRLEDALKHVMKSDKKACKKILSSYMNLLTAHPDQPYGQPAIKHPFDGYDIVKPKDTMPPGAIMPKDQMVLKIAEEKIAAGGKVLIYTNWTRLDTPKRLLKLVTERGWNATILEAKVKPEAREDWVQDRLDHGLQVLIGNPSLVETGLDLNAFTTLIFYDTGYKLFTLRQASLRSWRINQSAPRVEVYMLYHAGTMQHKAIKLMASKLAAAGMIEGSFSEEGLSAMSECEDMTTLMARELMMGIKDSVEDLAATFKRMAMLKPQTAAWSIFSDEVRKTDSAVLGRSSPSILEFTFGTEERTVPQAAVLPQDSPVFFETAKAEHKRKKGEVDEDQLLLFQIA